MLKIRRIGLGVCLMGWLICAQASAADLTVWVSGMQTLKGNLEVALYRAGERFPVKNAASAMQRVKVTKSKMAFVFADLPEDDYAVVVYHDENGNLTFDENFLGVPQERFGFSNRAKPSTFAAPTFEQAKIHFKHSETIQIQLMSW